MKQIKYIFTKLFCIFCMLIPISAWSAAWTQPKGDWILLPEFDALTSRQFWDNSGHLRDGPPYYQQQFNIYGEYGLTPCITIGMNPFFRGIQYDGTAQSFTLNNSEIFGRYLFWKGDYSAFSGQLTVNIPFTTQRLRGNPISQTVAPFAMTARQVYVDGRLLYGTGGVFNTQTHSTWYADFQSGVRQFFGGASSEFHFDITAAWKSPQSRVVLELKEFNTIRFNNPNGPTDSNYDLFTLSPGIVYFFDPHFGIQAGVMQDLYGINVGRSTTPFIKIWRCS